MKEALAKCEQYLNIPSSTKVILTLGQYALFSLTGQKGLTETRTAQSETYKSGWRGYAFSSHNPTMVDRYIDLSPQVRGRDERIILATMHIAALYQPGNAKYWFATLQDFNKARRALEGKWPKPLPFISSHPPKVWPTYAAFDTEYTFPGNKLIRWSLADKEGMVYVVEAEQTFPIAIDYTSTIIFQNEIADRRHLSTIIDFSKVKAEDLMLGHSVLHPGQPHSLNYLNSIYGSWNRHKHLSENDETLYAGLDALTTLEDWVDGLIPEFNRDTQSWLVYKRYRLPLTPLIDDAKRRGIPVHRERVDMIKALFEKEKEKVVARAAALVGDEGFNIGSSMQVGKYLMDLYGVGEDSEEEEEGEENE